MSDLKHRLAEDRALRDAALALFKADLAFVRTDLKDKTIGARLAKRLGDGALGLADDALDYAEDNKGKIATGVAALVAAAALWFARRPILRAVAGLLGSDED